MQATVEPMFVSKGSADKNYFARVPGHKDGHVCQRTNMAFVEGSAPTYNSFSTMAWGAA